MLTSYLKYLTQRKSEYSIHSPFVYDFMRKVLNDSGSNRDYDTIYRIARLLDKRKHVNFLLRVKPHPAVAICAMPFSGGP